MIKEGLNIIKVGGAVVEDEESLKGLLMSFSGLRGKKILVHGGGKIATEVASRLGIETQMIDGRRITSAEMLKVVTMVYGGLVNKDIVARLQALGENAIGLTGADMNLIMKEEAIALYKDYYKDEPFVHVIDSDPDLKMVVNTNKCVLNVRKHGRKLHVISMIDNLIKGASGQAVQNMNLVFGLPEDTGLHLKASRF